MKTRGKSKKITAQHAIDKFYKAHKAELDIYFGNERTAKAHLKYDTGLNLVGTNYPKKATEKLNEYLDWIRDPQGSELKEAKAEAIYNASQDGTNTYTKMTQLNRKIDPNDYNMTSKVLGKKNGFDVTALGYYDIKNSDYVLARTEWYQGKTKIEAWEFVEKNRII